MRNVVTVTTVNDKDGGNDDIDKEQEPMLLVWLCYVCCRIHPVHSIRPKLINPLHFTVIRLRGRDRRRSGTHQSPSRPVQSGAYTDHNHTGQEVHDVMEQVRLR